MLNKLYRFDEAIHCISRSVYIKSLHFSTEMNASYATSLDHLGLIAREQGKYQDALAHHARALQIRKEVMHFRFDVMRPSFQSCQTTAIGNTAAAEKLGIVLCLQRRHTCKA